MRDRIAFNGSMTISSDVSGQCTCQADLSHSERQYKAKIQQMALERNVKALERKAIVQNINHRKYALGKKTGLVRVRGRRIAPEKLSRWMRELATDVPPMSANSLSRKFIPTSILMVALTRATAIAIPSCISIRTDSSPEPSEICLNSIIEPQRLGTEVTADSDARSALLQRTPSHSSPLPGAEVTVPSDTSPALLQRINSYPSQPLDTEVRAPSDTGPTLLQETPSHSPQPLDIEVTAYSDTRPAFLQSTSSHFTRHLMKSQEGGSVFNDLRILLDLERNKPGDLHDDQWNPAVKQDIESLRILLDVTQNITVYNEAKGRQQWRLSLIALLI